MATIKQLRFAQNIIEGMPPSQAYKKAGYACKNPETIAVEAQRLLKNPSISPIIQTAQAKATETATWNRTVAIERLQRVNDAAYAAVNNGNLTSRGAAGVFFGSLDRLNALLGIVAEDPNAASLARAEEILGTIKSVITDDTLRESNTDDQGILHIEV
ncbi:MAG: terminase small subunit [Coriobacteriales bacterium]|nr:terminase small subunit [Coriobacteriales bacterium]